MATNDEIMAQCAGMNADIRNIGRTLDEIKSCIERHGQGQAITNTRLAVIERVQNDMRESVDSYQKDCDKERGGLDKRITSIEGFQMRQIKAAAAVSAIVAFIATNAIDLLKGRM